MLPHVLPLHAQFACQRPQQAEGMPNAHLSADMLEEVMGMDEKAHALIEDAATKQGFLPAAIIVCSR